MRGRSSGEGKRKIVQEAVASLREDPLSVQFLGPWFRSLLPGRDSVRDALPWMTFRAIRWLRSCVAPDAAVFEYGAGGSTLFLARRARTVVSVESDPAWYDRVSRALRAEGISNCDLRLVPPDPIRSGGSGRESRYAAPEMAGRTFEAYVRTIDEFPDGAFDLVAIDGYARPACIAHAVRKIRGGGHLLLDNSDWDVYREAMATLEGFPRTDFNGVGPFRPTSWRTSVWRM